MTAVTKEKGINRAGMQDSVTWFLTSICREPLLTASEEIELGNQVQRMMKIIEDKIMQATLLFGHSLGGAISIMYAANHPEYTKALIIGDNPMNSPGSPMQRQLKNLGIWPVYEDYYKGYDVMELLPKIKCPTLLIRTNSRKGGLIPDSDLRRVMELKPGIQYVYFEKIGHGLFKENPKEVLQSINDFLNQL